MATQPTTTATAEIWIDGRDILHVRMLPGSEQTIADARETTGIALRMGAGRPTPLLTDLRAMKSLARDAREHYGSAEMTKTIPAIAILVGSRVSMLIANFFINVTSPVVPTRIFTDEAEAAAWLMAHRR